MQEGCAIGQGHIDAVEIDSTVLRAGVHAQWGGQLRARPAPPLSVWVGAPEIRDARIAHGSTARDVWLVDGEGGDGQVDVGARHAEGSVEGRLGAGGAGLAYSRPLRSLEHVGSALQAAFGHICKARGAWGAIGRGGRFEDIAVVAGAAKGRARGQIGGIAAGRAGCGGRGLGTRPAFHAALGRHDRVGAEAQSRARHTGSGIIGEFPCRAGDAGWIRQGYVVEGGARRAGLLAVLLIHALGIQVCEACVALAAGEAAVREFSLGAITGSGYGRGV